MTAIFETIKLEPLKIDRGATFLFSFELFEDEAETLPTDLDGYKIYAQARADRDEADSEIPAISIDTEGTGGIAISGGDNNIITGTLTFEQSNTLEQGTLQFDIFFESGAERWKAFETEIIVNNAITRIA